MFWCPICEKYNGVLSFGSLCYDCELFKLCVKKYGYDVVLETVKLYCFNEHVKNLKKKEQEKKHEHKDEDENKKYLDIS